MPTRPLTQPHGDERSPESPRGHVMGLAIVVLLCGVLFLPNLRWGLPGLVSWSQDSIAGVRALGAVEGWPDRWRGRYPPLHYLILSAAYQPWLAHWESTGERYREPGTKAWTLSPPQAPKIASLVLIARVLSAAMGLAAALGVYATAWALDDRPLVATLAAASLVCGAAFVYFAQLDNVDVPSVGWMAWSAFFYARLLRDHRWFDAAALGSLAALAVATKDSVAGIYPGMALVLLVEAIRRFHSSRGTVLAAGRALLQPHWILGLVCFIVPCLYLNGAFHDSEAYLDRLRYWIDPPEGTLHARQTRYAGMVALAAVTVREAGGAVGWPMVAALLLSALHALHRRRRLAWTLLAPAAAYWLIVILPIRFVYDRFLFPPLALLSILVAVWLVDLGVGTGRFATLRRLMPALILLPTLGYAAAVHLEMRYDSRYAAEGWFQKNVPHDASVGAFAPGDDPRLRPQYLPRVHELGYATYPVVMSAAWLQRPQPDYLVLSSFDYEDFGRDQRSTMHDLLRGQFGYRLAAQFGPRFLGTGSHWLGLAGWGGPVPGKISPTLLVLQRMESPGSAPTVSPPQDHHLLPSERGFP